MEIIVQKAAEVKPKGNGDPGMLEMKDTSTEADHRTTWSWTGVTDNTTTGVGLFEFNSQHPHLEAHNHLLILAPEDLPSSSRLSRQLHSCTYPHTDK